MSSPAITAADGAARAQLDPWLDGVHQAQLAAFYEAVSQPRFEPSKSSKNLGGTQPPVAYKENAVSSLQPCGGDLPPCWVKKRESHGNYNAYNPIGCVWTDKDGTRHRGCFGAWQFGTMWAGKLGLPEDLSTATPAQQDEAARQLWNGGAGCSNWSAC